jgi:hypothetical protein
MNFSFNAVVYRTPVPVIAIVTMAVSGLLGVLLGFVGQAFSVNVSFTDAFVIGAASSAATFVTYWMFSLFSPR